MVEKGQIFYESWGYDQTNIDYLVVDEVSKSGKTVICQMMTSAPAPEDHVTPARAFGVRFRMWVRKYGDREVLHGKYPYVQHDGGEAHYRSGGFWIYERPMYETPLGYGH